MKITNTRVYGLEETLIASGFPMLSKPYSEEEFEKEVEELKEDLAAESDVQESKHLTRIKKLASAPNGSGHNNALKGIIVQFNLGAPRYFWNQAQRYNFLDLVSSMSQMHRIKCLELGSNVDTALETYKLAKTFVEKYEQGLITIDKCLANMPQGLEITARLSTNYLQLKTIYSQRRTHKSRHWQEFCDWIETLPYAEELIIGKKG